MQQPGKPLPEQFRHYDDGPHGIRSSARAHYGAEVELIPGTRQDTADEAERQAERIFYASHNWQAFFLQGTKTLAYELWEDLGFRAPFLGCDIGFGELLRRGEIERLPRLFAVQPANCAPLCASFASGPTDARTARSFGAEGIGLCRTEHMFFEGERIVAMREMILADDEEGGRAARIQPDARLPRRAARGPLSRASSLVAPAAVNSIRSILSVD